MNLLALTNLNYCLPTYLPLCLTYNFVSDEVDYMVVATFLENYSPVYPEIEGRIILTTSSSAGVSLQKLWVILSGAWLFVYNTYHQIV